MKRALLLFLILAVYFWMNTATKYTKEMPFPLCYNKANQYLIARPELEGFIIGFSADTLIIRANKDSIWSQTMDTICKTYRDSCNFNRLKILIVDSSTTNWDTRYGHKLYFRQCP